MNTQELIDIAKTLVAGDKGLLAMDESNPTCTWGPSEAEKLTAGICGCDNPVELLPHGKDGELK